MIEPLIATGITYLYPNGKGIKRIDFSAEKGEVLCFSGSNGSGKTTLIKVLATLFRPQEGTLVIQGFDSVRNKEQARGTFFPVFDESAHLGSATGAKNLELFLNLYGSVPRDRIDHYAHHFKLDLGVAVDEYSLGMKRKLILMEALLSGKAILMFDEPTLGLDSVTRSAFFQFTKELSEQGTTIIFGTNRKEEAARANRILFLDTGNLSSTPPESNLRGMIELHIIMEHEEFTEYVISFEEIPDVIARILLIGIPRQIHINSPENGDLLWTEVALEKAGRAPPLVRRMVIGIVERYAREQGYHRITPEVVEEAKQRFEPR